MTLPEPGFSREALVAAILDFLGEQDLLSRHDIRSILEREVDAAGPDALLALRDRLSMDAGWGYYPRDPLAQRIHHLLADRFLEPGSEAHGLQRLVDLVNVPIVIVANHLSYADANAIEVLLHRGGAGAFADRLTALAGPKVFTSRERRFSSLCFGNIKVPQSSDLASEEAVLSPREVAKAARQAIEAAHERLRCGDVLVLFAEGTRSRSGAMQPMLSATARYLEVPGTMVVPAGLTGPERLFPLDGGRITPARVTLQLGPALDAGALFERTSSDRKRIMDTIGFAVAATLPARYRGVYGDSM